MNTKELLRFLHYPLFLYILPVFFVLHGFTENFFLVPVKAALVLLLKYLLLAAVFHAIFYFIYRRSHYKAVLFSFCVLFVCFFFGAFHDQLRKWLPGTFYVRYSVVLSFLCILLIVLFILIRKKKKVSKLPAFFNMVFLCLILLDGVIVITKIQDYDPGKNIKQFNPYFSSCDTCYKPDVYLIIADGYAGPKTLQDQYGFDNSPFLDQLRQRGFLVPKNSISNYNLTPVSMASMLNLTYPNYEGHVYADIYLQPMYRMLDTSSVVSFFKFMGYKFINNSIFLVSHEEPRVDMSFIPVGTKIIDGQTIWTRCARYLATYLRNKGIIAKDPEENQTVRVGNETIIDALKQTVLEKHTIPVFCYSHLLMPHAPYYFDSKGNPYPESDLGAGAEWLDTHYVEYLQYSNKVLLGLVDYILKNSKTPPVIMLLSDHGFRRFSHPVTEDYYYYNLNATYLPLRYKADFREGISNIAYMKSLLNLLYNQHIPVDTVDKYIPLIKFQRGQ